ncbi:hypothetical protein NDU88_013257 [Pleurodeles waltl]|uniref:Uncharacterized protein n=1 Tax=Pleurodeles waltl TaxID=8319 RepID=A0AAV7R2J7_PLEWA|nr:hypothetical protein NDU88_013257 [Pleurodeles waltl]
MSVYRFTEPPYIGPPTTEPLYFVHRTPEPPGVDRRTTEQPYLGPRNTEPRYFRVHEYKAQPSTHRRNLPAGSPRHRARQTRPGVNVQEKKARKANR